jgi:CrcB protein
MTLVTTVGPRGLRRDVLLAVAAGGALGSLARYGVGELVPRSPGGVPVATLLVNVVGSAGLGALMAFVEHGRVARLLRPFLGVGVFGGFTTASTFAVEAVELMRQGEVAVAGGYVVGSLAGSLVAVAAGFMGTTRRLRRRGQDGGL